MKSKNYIHEKNKKKRVTITPMKLQFHHSFLSYQEEESWRDAKWSEKKITNKNERQERNNNS